MNMPEFSTFFACTNRVCLNLGALAKTIDNYKPICTFLPKWLRRLSDNIPDKEIYFVLKLCLIKVTIRMMGQTTTPPRVARLVRRGAIKSQLATKMLQSTDTLKEIKAILININLQPEHQTDISNVIGRLKQQLKEQGSLENLLVQVGAIGEFIYFNKLPMELRTMIWRETLPERQVMNVSWVNDNQIDANGERIPILACKTPPPAMLQVCSESRQVVFSTLTGVLSGGLGQQRRFRYNPARDLVYVSINLKKDFILGDRVALWSVDTLRNLKNFAIDSRIVDQQLHAYENEYLDRGKVDSVLIAGFWRLEKLIVVVHGHDLNVHNICSKGWSDARSPGFARTSDEYVIEEFRRITKELIKYEKKAMRRRGMFYSHHHPKILIRVGLRDGELCCHSDSRLLE